MKVYEVLKKELHTVYAIDYLYQVVLLGQQQAKYFTVFDYCLPAVCTEKNVVLASVHKEKTGDQALSQKKSCYRGGGCSNLHERYSMITKSLFLLSYGFIYNKKSINGIIYYIYNILNTILDMVYGEKELGTICGIFG